MDTLVNELKGWEKVRVRQQEQMRDAILEIVSAPGMPLTVADVCARAGVSRPTFYKYFPTLGAAMLHVFNWVMDEMIRESGVSDDSGLTGLEVYLAEARAAFAVSCRRPELTRFISFLDYTFRTIGMTAEESAAIESTALRAADHERQIVRRGQADGSIRSDISANEIVNAVGSALLGLRQRIQITESYLADGVAMGYRVHELELAAWGSYLAAPPNGNGTPPERAEV